jgi:hypothetical protein
MTMSVRGVSEDQRERALHSLCSSHRSSPEDPLGPWREHLFSVQEQQRLKRPMTPKVSLAWERSPLLD